MSLTRHRVSSTFCKNMRSTILLLFLAIPLFLYTGCKESSTGGYSGSEEAIVDDIESAFDDVKRRLRGLGYEVDEFDSENWRENVRDVEYEFGRLKRAVSNVESEFPSGSVGSRIDDIEGAFDDVKRRLKSLGYEIDDFDSEDWEDNVSDVEYEFGRLKRAVSNMEREF